jgi:hypothetical protein
MFKKKKTEDKYREFREQGNWIVMFISVLIYAWQISLDDWFSSTLFLNYISVEDDVGSVIDILLGFRLALKLFGWLYWRVRWSVQISGNA